ncbi:hypothetical protein BDF19DRAFT_22280 [Syncephalis fuscata]|nr:hypothetical protein BDF19DRAFT_22280 [Syncephalis fuscata]
MRSDYTPSVRGGLTTRSEYDRLKSSIRRSEWELATPLITSSYNDDPSSTTVPDTAENEIDRQEWEDEQTRLDRDWYNSEEFGVNEDTPFGDHDAYYRKKEEELTQRQVKRMSARQAQYNQDNELWETNRMLTSGIMHRTQVDTDFDNDDDVITY